MQAMKAHAKTLLACLALALAAACEPSQPDSARVRIETSMGDIVLLLEPQKAPVTVENFLAYVDSDGYQDTVFHRVIPGFMVQGGGYRAGSGYGELAPVREPIVNEADNGLRNLRGTVAMARAQPIDSATRQFFINVVDNPHLDHGPESCTRQQVARGELDCPSFGYAVFGRVETGMDIVELMVMTETRTVKRLEDVPVEEVVIHSIKRL